jgi:5-methylcytosine-specific restriction enzyme A
VAHRDTGPSRSVRAEVVDRFGGCCVRCGRRGATVQHRRPRQAGGSRDPQTNSAANLLWVCGDGTRGCHGHMESYRAEAYRMGWLVPAHATPAAVPVRLWDGSWVRLDDDGGWCFIEDPGTPD